MDKAKEEENMMITLTQIITNLIGCKEIERFKQLRQKAYYQMLKEYSKCEKDLAVAERDIWARASYHDRINLEVTSSFSTKQET
jgi:hypothetical protein